MRAALVTVLLVMGCSKKSDTAKQTPEDKAGATAAEAPKPPEDQSAEAKPSEAKPPEANPPADALKIDCAALVTPEDVKKACGGANVEIVVNANEGKNPALGMCWRTLAQPGKKFPLAQVFVNVFADAKGAESWVKLEKTPEAKELSGVGDFAWTREAEMKDLKATDYDVGVRKGRVILKLTSTKSSLNKTPPCNLDQLTELAKIIATRLPS